MTNEELCERIQHGETELLSILWEQTRRLAIKKAFPYLPRDGSSQIEIGDFESAAFFAIIEAVKTFNFESHFAFSTWVCFYFKNYFRKVCGIGKDGTQKNDAVSLDATITAEGDGNLGDFLIDDNSEAAYETIFDNEILGVVLSEIEKLPKKQKNAVIEYYLSNKTLQKIADEDGVSKEAVRQALNGGIRNLQKNSVIKELATIGVYQ